MTSTSSRHAGSRRLALVVLLATFTGCSSTSSGGAPPPGAASGTFTIHYHRPLADYAGWKAAVSEGALPASVDASATDGFGAVYVTSLSGSGNVRFSLVNGAATDGAGTLSVDVSGSAREAWVLSGWSTAVPRRPPAVPGPNQAAFYYLRRDGNYAGWGIHLWGALVAGTSWGAPLMPVGVDPDLGAGFLVDRAAGVQGNCPTGVICLIVHKGDTKDPGPDITGWNLAALGNVAFETTGTTAITTFPVKPSAISDASAHLVTRNLLVWNVTSSDATSFQLLASPDGSIVDTGADVAGGSPIPLTRDPAGLPPALVPLMPQFAFQPWLVYDVGASQATVEQALKGQLVAVARAADGSLVKASRVQTSWALDDLYAYDGPLGVTFAGGAPTFLLWAPTALSVRLQTFDAAKAPVADVPMVLEPQGVWSYAGPSAWVGQYYRYALDVFHPATQRIEHVVVTDPYAVNLSTNGLYAQVVDLSDPSLAPPGWSALAKPPLDAPEDIVLYEGHVRDFSAGDLTVPAERRGKFLAFAADTGTSDGRTHLQALAAAGLTHLHLLPAFDLATVDEDASARVDVDQPFSLLCATNPATPHCADPQLAGSTIAQALASFPGDSDQQQAIVNALRPYDSFNWGYDPFHFGAPEGSYASTAEGTAKILEFREMVQGLAALGLRVVLDVVYNHTNAAGLGPTSVLDKIVPGYYHRLNPETGVVESSSCCANTASERHMMGRILVDHTVRWAREYKVDGFRFDLMGLHMKSNMIAVRDALAALTPAADGVDGSKLYVYGEGWNMGEVANNARGVTATQLNMPGTGVGTFNDRLRDAVRGGSPFDHQTSLRSNQGFATGLATDPNELAAGGATDLATLGTYLDWIKVGMAGNLRDFRLVTSSGAVKTGGAINYGTPSQPAGYALDPQEAINYVSAHDNQTLWDIAQYKLPAGRTMADRVRAHDVALDTVLLGQGIPFFHMGDDVLRSKSMDGNSYDSGDWFNRVDWTGQGNNWRVGLPPAGDNGQDWPLIEAIFADTSIAPSAIDVAAASAHFREMLQVRKSSRLFRLTTGADVQRRVDFVPVDPTAAPGVVVMTVTDGTDASCGSPPLADLDPARDAVVVVVNADVASHAVTVPGASGFTLHPVLAASADPVVRTASAAGDTFTVPARTTAVFERLQGGAQGTGLPCNTR